MVGSSQAGSILPVQSLEYQNWAQNPCSTFTLTAPACVGSAWQAAVVVPTLVTCGSASVLDVWQFGKCIKVTSQTGGATDFTSRRASKYPAMACWLESGSPSWLDMPSSEDESHGQYSNSNPYGTLVRSGSSPILRILASSQIPAVWNSSFGLYLRHRSSPQGIY